MAEGRTKAEGELTLKDAEAKAATIAVWLKPAHRRSLTCPAAAHDPGPASYDVLHRLENQIVAGDGSGENIRGILDTTGIGDIASPPPPR